MTPGAAAKTVAAAIATAAAAAAGAPSAAAPGGTPIAATPVGMVLKAEMSAAGAAPADGTGYAAATAFAIPAVVEPSKGRAGRCASFCMLVWAGWGRPRSRSWKLSSQFLGVSCWCRVP